MTRQLFSIGKTISPTDLLAFSRQMASFLEAGIPILDALEIVGAQSESALMREVVADIRGSILRGTSFVDAVAAHPLVFPGYYRAMLLSAEFTGDLDTVMNVLAGYIERDLAARRQIKSALTYPIIVLVVAIVAMVAMTMFVLPKFTDLYRNLDAQLPVPTRMLLGFTDFVTNWWPFLFGAVFIGTAVVGLTLGGERGKQRRDAVATRTPFLGDLMHLIAIERFCRVLSALVTAGVPLPIAIGVSADSTNNSRFESKMVVVRDTIVRGGGLYDPLVESGLFPLPARQMIQVGERTGTLGNQLSKAATYYDREVGFSMKRATDLFEPMVILFVGLIVGFVAVAQVSAMYSIFGQVK
ncbi:MAG: type II secretion system F family protein [Actinobacteria bacterium]|nr:type II secretion system F family protein [Actinomycetota bacterium]